MANHNGEPKTAKDRHNTGSIGLSRRRWLYLAGAGIVGSTALGSVGAVSPDQLGHVITFDGTETGSKTSYEFSVSGEVESNENDGAIESKDTINGSSVSGSVNGDRDSYRFSGHLTGLDVQGIVKVTITYAEVPTGDRLEIVSSTDEDLSYRFTSMDTVEKVLDNGDNSAEKKNDRITENDDGSWTVDGFTGNGYGDGYDLYGEVASFTANGTYTLFLNGEEITLEELLGENAPDDVETHRIEIVSEASDFDYSFTTSDDVTKVFDNGDRSAEKKNDSVSENGDGTWTVEGFTGNGYGDAYDFKGSITDFSPMDGQFTLYLDGTQLTAYELLGEEPPDDDTSSSVDGGPVGGGSGYANTVAESEADVVVTTRDELADAISSARSGDTIYVAGNVSIDMGSETHDVPDGVTIASNRGINDAPGGHLYTEGEEDIFHLGDDCRLTGLRIQGPYYEYFDPDHYATGDALEAKGDNVEIDNCEIWGFAHASVGLEGDAGHVHHNHIHHNSRDGLGYGVVVESSGHQLIEWNYFNYNRHSVASGGSGGYTVRYNRFGPDTIDHVMDVHRPGGDRTEIYNNTVEATHSLVDGQRDPAVAIRGVPDDIADIHHNWFYNPAEPRDRPSGWTTESIIQVHVDDWTNVQWADNHLGDSEPPSDIGCPR